MIPTLFSPGARYREPWSGSVVVLAPGAIPTTDFYLTPRLRNVAGDLLFHFDSRHLDELAKDLPQGAFVVIVRHARADWLNFLYQHRHLWSGVAFLMDDDIPGAWRSSDVPFHYGTRTTGRYLRVRQMLSRVCDRVWKSTEALRKRHAQIESIVVGPLDFDPGRVPAPVGTRRWGYHGSPVHFREIRWLLPVVAAVHQAVPEAEFEVFGNHQIKKMFASVPRVEVKPYGTWREYLAHSRTHKLAVGVAPLLPGRFNAVRSHIKAYDIARCGAVGVFSARDPYLKAMAGAGVALLPDNQAAWAAEVIKLLQDDRLRLHRFGMAREWMDAHFMHGDIADLIEGKSA
ncbi:MAG: hypothetical protein U1E96_10650 [Azonexus sp.]